MHKSTRENSALTVLLVSISYAGVNRVQFTLKHYSTKSTALSILVMESHIFAYGFPLSGVQVVFDV